MDYRFYNGFEKKAALRDTLSKVKNMILGNKASRPKMVTKPATKPAREIREIAPKGSVIMPPKKAKPVRKDPPTLDYKKINADVAAEQAARRKRLREGGSTINYSNRLGSPVVTHA